AAVEEVCKKVNMPRPKIYMIPGETPNAFSTGKGRRTASIAFTEGILKSIEPEELRGVIAHELIHIKNGDALVGSFAATFAALFGLGMGHHESMSKQTHTSGFREFVNTNTDRLRILIAPVAAYLIRILVSRSREYEADQYAATLSGNPLAMANAIRTMEKKKYIRPAPASPLAAHLFTVNPLTEEWALRLFNTHPPMEKRIERLQSMAQRSAYAIDSTLHILDRP
ncbi:MAG: M48 family metalloprotease, partial [bacterium]